MRLSPIAWVWPSCLAWKRGLVSGSATFASVWTLQIHISPLSMNSQIIWYVLSTCLDLLCDLDFFCLSCGTIVVTVEIHRIIDAKDHPKFDDELFDPHSFLCSFGSCDVLYLCRCRISNSALLGTFPTHYSSIQTKDKSRLRFEIIFVCLKTCIGVTFYNELVFLTIY